MKTIDCDHTREILAITYNNDAIFENRSATLRPGAHAEVGRVAHLIGLFPEMSVDVEVSAPPSGKGGQGRLLQRRRVGTIRKTLLDQGVDAERVRTTLRTTIHGDMQTPRIDDTVHFRVCYAEKKPAKPWPDPIPRPYRRGGGYPCHAS